MTQRSLTKWWDDDVLRYLPLPCNEMKKLCCEIIGMQGDSSSTIEMVDPYHDYNRPFEYTVLMECFEFKMFHTLRDLAPTFSESFSPFVVRGRSMGQTKGPSSKNPVISGRSSTTSNNSSDSNGDSSSDDDLTNSTPTLRLSVPSPLSVVAKILKTKESNDSSLFPAIKRMNRILLNEPSKRDMIMYKRYVNFERRSNPRYKSDIHVVMTVNSAFRIDSSVDVIPPTVSKASREIYQDYINRNTGRLKVGPASVAAYKKYINFCL